MSDSALILAAGLGTRMKELTQETPKPLLDVAGRPLIDHILDDLSASGVENCIVNLHSHADQLEAHLKKRMTPQIRYSDERAHLLETGGGYLKALPLLPQNTPSFVANSDTIFQSAPGKLSAVETLRHGWDDKTMDCLLLMIERDKAQGHEGRGDFFMAENGQLHRRGNAPTAPYIFTGLRLIHPRLAKGFKAEPFSFNMLFDKALLNHRLHGVTYDGQWIDVGTKQALLDAQALLN